MKYRISDKSEIEDLIIEHMTKFFVNELKIDRIYRNFGAPNISKIHPFTNLLYDEISGHNTAVLPAISVAVPNDNSEDIIISRNEEPVEITLEDVQQLIAQNYALTEGNGHLTKLERFIKTNDRSVYGSSINRRYRQQIVIEIWGDNQTVKDHLYEGIKDWIDFDLDVLYAAGFENVSINGSKHGDYNFDFGKILYGANITLTGIVGNLVLKLDDEIQTIQDVRLSTDTTNFATK